jgi:hypothetical protein
MNTSNRNKIGFPFAAAAVTSILLCVSAASASAQEVSNPSPGVTVRTSAVLPTGLQPVGFEVAEASPGSAAAFQRNPVLSAVHLGLGYATVAAGFATGIFNPGVVEDDVHASLGYAAAGLAATTMAVGALAHYGEVGPGFKWSSNNIHALLGIAGGTMMMIAPFIAPGGDHKVVGMTGAALMGVSVVWKLVY